MSKYRAYPVYKESGVEWLGEVPEHWKVRRLKFTVSHNDETLPENTPEDEIIEYVDISSVDLIEGITKTEQLSFEKAPSRARRLVKNGDTIISTVRTYLKAIAFIENAPDNLVVSTGFAVIRPSNNVDAKFFAYFFQGQFFIDKVVANSVGVSYPAINASDLVCIAVSYPEKNEQQQIAAFLDEKTAHLDTLIEKKQQMIGLLNEKRIALITQAVTKGLDLSVPMKDSGVEWLGNVPEHWEVLRLKFLVNFVGSGKTPKGGATVYVNSGIMILRSQNIHDDGLELSNVAYITDDADNAQLSTRVQPEDVLLNITGASIGRASIAPLDIPLSNVNQHVCIIRPNKNVIYPKFLHLMIISKIAKEQIFSLETGSSREGLNFPQIENLIFPVPKKEEQLLIIDFVNQETAKIDRMINTVQSAIAKLQEYRTALITAAVTGKIDVRTLTPHEG